MNSGQKWKFYTFEGDDSRTSTENENVKHLKRIKNLRTLVENEKSTRLKQTFYNFGWKWKFYTYEWN